MPDHRLGIEQLPLILRPTLHEAIVPAPHRGTGTTRSCSGVS